MIQTTLLLCRGIQHLADARLFFEDSANRTLQRRVITINVSDLMISHREDLAGAAVEQFHAQLFFDAEPTLFSKKPIQVNGGIDRADAVFGKQDHLNGSFLEKINEVADDPIDLAKVLRNRR